MNEMPTGSSDENCTQKAAKLNRECLCNTLQPEALAEKKDTYSFLEKPYKSFFANTSVFISHEQYTAMQELIQAIERVIASPGFEGDVLASMPLPAGIKDASAGVFMGYDFHLGDNGPQLIEINTNAGGPFLNSTLLDIQDPCCAPVQNEQHKLDQEFIQMFLQEWRSQGKGEPLRSIAIVDEHPENQFLYPEFKIAQHLFEQHDIKAFITAPQDLMFDGNQLWLQNCAIDMVYNRLTDFSLKSYPNLFDAYQHQAIVLTPNPRHHALYANKRNLSLLTDPARLAEWGIAKSDIERLQAGIPKTHLVTKENAEALWKNRKHLFFKPLDGFGSRAAYRGDKLTKRVWEEIQQGKYVAQHLAPANERRALINGVETILKMDIRAYVYRGNIQLLAARLYQGQTTNFRTPGGGFAPVRVTLT